MALKKYYTELLLLLCMAVVTPGTAQKKAIDSIQSLMESPRGDQLPNDSRMKNYLKLSEQTVRFNTAQALNYGKKALAAAKAIPHQLGEAMALNLIGNAFANTSLFDSARIYYDSSYAIMQVLHDTTGIIQVINNLGILAKLEGNYKLAIQFYKESYRLASARHDTVGMVLTTNNIGIVYYDWKQFDVALEHYQKALAMLRKQGDSTRMAVLLNNAGELLKETGKPDEALANYFESLEISLKRGMRMTSMNSYVNIGDVYLARKEYDSARKNFQHALGLSQAIQYPFGLALSHIRLGEALMMLNHDATAFQHLSTGAALAKQQNDLVLKRDASLNLYRYHQKQGQYKEALSTFHDYTAARDSLFNQNSRKEMAILRTEYETDKKENEIKLLTQEKAIQMLEVERHKNLFLYTLLIAISLLLAGWLAYTRFRLKQKNIKNELEKLNLEIEQRLLRSQMSPHFIFNSLNSINSFIAANNSLTAQTFLTKFAELIRLILENSRKTLTSLADELRTLQL
jgi:tetratricopeptide (TPR) repeat protein